MLTARVMIIKFNMIRRLMSMPDKKARMVDTSITVSPAVITEIV